MSGAKPTPHQESPTHLWTPWSTVKPPKIELPHGGHCTSTDIAFGVSQELVGKCWYLRGQERLSETGLSWGATAGPVTRAGSGQLLPRAGDSPRGGVGVRKTCSWGGIKPTSRTGHSPPRCRAT